MSLFDSECIFFFKERKVDKCKVQSKSIQYIVQYSVNVFFLIQQEVL